MKNHTGRTEIEIDHLERLIAEGLAVEFCDKNQPVVGDTVLSWITGDHGRPGNQYFLVPAIVVQRWSNGRKVRAVTAKYGFNWAGGSPFDRVRSHDHSEGGDETYILRSAREDLVDPGQTECEGHPDEGFSNGQTYYCDGSCARVGS